MTNPTSSHPVIFNYITFFSGKWKSRNIYYLFYIRRRSRHRTSSLFTITYYFPKIPFSFVGEKWRVKSEEWKSKNPIHLREWDFWWPGRDTLRRQCFDRCERYPKHFAVLKTSQSQNPNAGFGLFRRTPRVLIPSFFVNKKQHPPIKGRCCFGDPDGIRTRVTAVKGRCLRPLDHRAIVVAVTGFEPVTLRVWTACSSQLSYTAI